MSSEGQKVAGGFFNKLRKPFLSPRAGAPNKTARCNRKYCNDAIVASWFKGADLDGSGSICLSEFLNSSLAAHLTDLEARATFQSVDTDNSGTIDYKEFYNAVMHQDSQLNLAIQSSLKSTGSGILEMSEIKINKLGD